MNIEQARRTLGEKEVLRKDFFEVLRLIGRLSLDASNEVVVRELLLRCVEKMHLLPVDLTDVLREQLANQGYYPYLSKFELTWRNAIGIEFHRSEGMPNMVMHAEQFEVAQRLLAGKSTILSAPTSFGKSLLIEEVVASLKFKNIVVVEPDDCAC